MTKLSDLESKRLEDIDSFATTAVSYSAFFQHLNLSFRCCRAFLLYSWYHRQQTWLQTETFKYLFGTSAPAIPKSVSAFPTIIAMFSHIHHGCQTLNRFASPDEDNE